MEGKEFWIRTLALLSVLGDSYCLPRQEKCRCECCNRCSYNFSRGWKLALSSLGTFDINCHCCTAEVWCLIMLDRQTSCNCTPFSRAGTQRVPVSSQTDCSHNCSCLEGSCNTWSRFWILKCFDSWIWVSPMYAEHYWQWFSQISPQSDLYW